MNRVVNFFESKYMRAWRSRCDVLYCICFYDVRLFVTWILCVVCLRTVVYIVSKLPICIKKTYASTCAIYGMFVVYSVVYSIYGKL
jgi:hypothetical protein